MTLETPQNEYIKRLLERISQVPEANTPMGWDRLPPIHVSGLTALGFSRNNPFLLLISSQGRGLIDCHTGNKLARDPDDLGPWLDPFQLKCEGIGPASSEIFDIAGVFGGGLPTANPFGDSLTAVIQSWPYADLIFCGKNQSIMQDQDVSSCVKLRRDDFVAYGFSWCGSYFAVGMSGVVLLWRRKN